MTVEARLPSKERRSVQDPESARLDEARTAKTPWRKWGPYLSERQWGTVREDYSQDGNAWDYFTHDQARSRAYHWGEDGLAGISDDKQLLCFSVALWNGKDPILKERAVRPDEQRGQPRRRRQGILLLPRQHAHAFLHEVPVQVSAGGISLRQSDRDQQGGATAATWSTSCWIPASSTKIATSMYSWSMPRQSPEDILIQISVSNRGPEPADITCPSDPVVSKYLDMVARHTQAVLEADLRPEEALRSLRRPTPIWVSGICTAREMSRCCSRKMRRTTSGSSVRPTPLLTSKTESTTTWCKEIRTP